MSSQRKKRKKLYNLIALCIVIGILTGSYFILKDRFGKDNEEETETPAISITDFDSKDIVVLKLEKKDGNIAFEKDDDEWIATEPYEVNLLQSMVDHLSESIANLEAMEIVSENPEDLEAYGLTDSAVKDEVRLKDDTIISVVVGKLAATGDRYYLMKDGDPALYTIRKTTGDILTGELSDFRDRSIPMISYEQDLQLFAMSGENIRDVEIRRKEEPDPELVEFDMGLLEMTKPYHSPMGIDMVQFGPILNAIPTFSIEDFVEDFPKDLSKYGLDKPFGRIIMKDSKKTVELILGDTADDGKRYFQVAGSDSVYTILDSKLDFMDKRPFDLVTKFALIVNIKDVDKIVIESKEVSHTLTMEREKLEGENPDDEEELVTYRVDNKIVTEDPFKRFYQILVGLSVDTEMATEPTEPSEVSVTYYLNKGNIKEVRLDFVPYDRDFYSIVRDGKSDFIIARNSIDNMLEELEALYES